jgi:hypothetical protein
MNIPCYQQYISIYMYLFLIACDQDVESYIDRHLVSLRDVEVNQNKQP